MTDVAKYFTTEEIADAAIAEVKKTNAFHPMDDRIWLNDPVASMVSSSAQARIGRAHNLSEEVDDDPEYFEMCSQIERDVSDFIKERRRFWRIKNR